MSTLARTTEKLRSIIKVGAVVVGSILSVYIIIMMAIFIKNLLFPSAPAIPKQEFGKLPQVEFELGTPETVQYLINTISGSLPPDFPDRMIVYKIQEPKPDLLALQNTRRIASTAGFTQQETKITDTLYQWTNPTTNAILQYDINTKTFEIRSNYLSTQNLLTNFGFPDRERIEKETYDFLRTLQVRHDILELRENSLTYMVLANNDLQKAENPFDGKVLRINFFNKNIQNNLGDFPLVYPNPEITNTNLVVSYPSVSRMVVLSGESYNYTPSEESSDYPIKSAEEAFEDLKNNNAYVYNPTDSKSLQITNVFLAYYLDKKTDEYLQPVVVFEGANFKAYVPAVKTAPSTPDDSSE